MLMDAHARNPNNCSLALLLTPLNTDELIRNLRNVSSWTSLSSSFHPVAAEPFHRTFCLPSITRKHTETFAVRHLYTYHTNTYNLQATHNTENKFDGVRFDVLKRARVLDAFHQQTNVWGKNFHSRDAPLGPKTNPVCLKHIHTQNFCCRFRMWNKFN